MCVTFCELPLWEICIPRIVQAEEILIGCFVECQSIKKVGGRRSVEELYQALFFVSPVPPECFTERNENRAWSQVSDFSASRQPSEPLKLIKYFKILHLTNWNVKMEKKTLIGWKVANLFGLKCQQRLLTNSPKANTSRRYLHWMRLSRAFKTPEYVFLLPSG